MPSPETTNDVIISLASSLYAEAYAYNSFAPAWDDASDKLRAPFLGAAQYWAKRIKEAT